MLRRRQAGIGDLDERLTTLPTLAAKITDNPYHEPEPDDHPGR